MREKTDCVFVFVCVFVCVFVFVLVSLCALCALCAIAGCFWQKIVQKQGAHAAQPPPNRRPRFHCAKKSKAPNVSGEKWQQDHCESYTARHFCLSRRRHRSTSRLRQPLLIAVAQSVPAGCAQCRRGQHCGAAEKRYAQCDLVILCNWWCREKGMPPLLLQEALLRKWLQSATFFQRDEAAQRGKAQEGRFGGG